MPGQEGPASAMEQEADEWEVMGGQHCWEVQRGQWRCAVAPRGAVLQVPVCRGLLVNAVGSLGGWWHRLAGLQGGISERGEVPSSQAELLPALEGRVRSS